MPTDVTSSPPEEYWVELNLPADPDELEPAGKGKKKKESSLPALVFLVHKWKEADALAPKKSVKATLSLFEVDSTEKVHGQEEPGDDERFARVELKITKQPDGSLAASDARVTKKDKLDPALGKKQTTEVKRSKEDDFAVWIGKKQFTFKVERGDMHDELADNHVEIGFTLQVGDNVYKSLPPHRSPTPLPMPRAIDDMLALPDRFSDPGRKPSIATADAVRDHQRLTLELLTAARGKPRDQVDVDIDGLPFELLLDGTTSRKEVVATLLDPDGPAYTGLTRKYFKDDRHDWLGDRPVLETVWLDGDIWKAYFTVHDIGIELNNRTELHYRASTESIRLKNGSPTGVHGFLNFTGIYAPSFELAIARSGTKAANPKKNKLGRKPPWAPYTCEIETVPVPYYRAGPSDIAVLAEKLSKTDEADQPEGWLPLNVPSIHNAKKGKQRLLGPPYEKPRKGQDPPDVPPYELACLTWKYPDGWGRREGHALKQTKKLRKKGEIGFLVSAGPRTLIEGLADLYLLASARAGHLLTITTHWELDRYLSGHSDPTGIDFDVLYDTITQRITRGGARLLPGLGGLEVPPGVRYGMHPQRIHTKAVSWRGIPLSRIHPGNHNVTFKTDFPQQSSVPTVEPDVPEELKPKKKKKRKPKSKGRSQG